MLNNRICMWCLTIVFGILLGRCTMGWLDGILRPAGPGIVGARSIDFGPVNRGQSLSAAFQLSNSGQRPLTIVRTTSSCGCAVVKEPPRIIAVGETLILEFRYTPDKRLGQHEAKLAVFSKELPPIVLLARAYVLAGYPERVDFGEVGSGNVSEKIVPIYSANGESYRILRMEYDVDRFDVACLSPAAEGNLNYIRVSLKHSTKVGPFSCNLRLITDDPAMPEKNLELVGEIVSPLRPREAVTEWDFGDLEDRATPRLHLSTRYCGDARISVVELGRQLLEFRIHRIGEEETIVLELPELWSYIRGPLEKGVLTITGGAVEYTFDVEFFAKRALEPIKGKR